MKTKVFYLIAAICLLYNSSFAIELQGTTVKHLGCNVVISLQIALESDSNDDYDVARLQATLNECWATECEMKCKDILKGNCYIKSEIKVVKWRTLAAADRTKYHHVIMKSGRGTCEVDELFRPNSGKSTGGTWYRDKNPKVYCHETMHLAGLPDRYRDCRQWRLDLHVDNCKDGIPCTAEEIAAGACPSCPGYEDDVMGNDVTKPFRCDENMMAIAKLAGPIYTHCSDSCCLEYHRPNNDYDPMGHNAHHNDSTTTPKIGIALDGGVGMFHEHNTVVKTDKLNALGYNFSLSGLYVIPLMQSWALNTMLQFNYLSVAKTRNITTGIYTQHDHFSFHIMTLSIAANAAYTINKMLSVYAGPEVGYIIGAKSQDNGTTTSTYTVLGQTQTTTMPYGDKVYRKVTADKNVQIGFNVGAMVNVGNISPFLNIYIPVTNAFKFTGLNNRMYDFNVGACYMFRK